MWRDTEGSNGRRYKNRAVGERTLRRNFFFSERAAKNVGKSNRKTNFMRALPECDLTETFLRTETFNPHSLRPRPLLLVEMKL